MSYILDALRRSEAERQREKRPDPLQVSTPVWGRQAPARPWWPLFLILVLALNGLLMGYWLVTRSAVPTASAPVAETQAPTPTRVPVPIPVPDPVPAASVDILQQADPAPAVRSIPEPLPVPEAESPTGSPVRTKETVLAAPVPDPLAAIPEIDALPETLRQSLPPLRFSSHIYSNDPAARRITINNQYLREGEKVQGLRVVEITEAGVVLSAQSQVFQFPVIRDWQPDGR